MNTAWNRFRYTLYKPLYDPIVKLLERYRKASIEQLSLHPDDRILIIGAGTGLDLEYLQGQKNITATDLTPSMVAATKARAKRLHIPVQTAVMNAEQLEYPDNSFDVVIAHLILAVIPDPIACIQETERVLVPHGQLIIMDKFVEPGKRPSLSRRILNSVAKIIATDINRDYQSLLNHTDLQIKNSQRLGHIFYSILAEKVN